MYDSNSPITNIVAKGLESFANLPKLLTKPIPYTFIRFAGLPERPINLIPASVSDFT